MSVAKSGFKSGQIFEQMRQKFGAMDDANRKAIINKVRGITHLATGFSYSLLQANGVFLFEIKNASGSTQEWSIDLKKKGEVTLGKGDIKPDIQIAVSDDDFENLATGKLNGNELPTSKQIAQTNDGKQDKRPLRKANSKSRVI